MAIGYGIAAPKPEPRKKTKARKDRQQLTHVHEVRAYVFARERDICRCCRSRAAHSMHELVFKSLGGKVSKKNSIAVCGSGTTLCHGFLQQHAIGWVCESLDWGAEMAITFIPESALAADHMKIKLGDSILSAPMRDMEIQLHEDV